MIPNQIKFTGSPIIVEGDGPILRTHAHSVVIDLPDIKAVSRNDTTGHYFKYQSQLRKAENWTHMFAKAVEYHFPGQVDVLIEAWYDTRGRHKAADTPNIDDKIFTDILNRYKVHKKVGRVQRGVWFIEDDNPTYLRYVTKRSIPSDHYAVRVTITEVINAD